MDARGDCHLLFVPVRESGSGVLALRTGRLPSGQRVGLAFTSVTSLLSELGPASRGSGSTRTPCVTCSARPG